MIEMKSPFLVCEHAIEFVGPSDVRGAALGGGTVVRHAEVQGLVAFRGRGDGVDVHHALGAPPVCWTKQMGPILAAKAKGK